MMRFILALRRISPSTWLRIATGFALLLFFLMHVVGAVRLSLLEELELDAYDLHLNATLQNTPDDRIVIADIDEKSIGVLGQWPWRRDRLAALVKTLLDDYKAKVVSFDIVFPEADRSDAAPILQRLHDGAFSQDSSAQAALSGLLAEVNYDRKFADALRGRQVVLGYVFDQTHANRLNTLPASVAELPADLRGQLPVPQPKGYTANLSLLQSEVSHVGFFDNPAVDIDGIYRRVPLLQEFNGQLYPSLALATAKAAMARPEIKVDVRAVTDTLFAVDSVTLGQYQIPVDASSAVLVPFRGLRGSFSYVSISDILNRSLPQAALQDKIVLIGTTAPGLVDLRPTPVQNVYPGVEVHANLIGGMLDERLLHQPEYMLGAEVLLLTVLTVLMLFIAARLAPLLSIIFVALLIGAVLLLRVVAWNSGVLLPVTSAILLVALLYLMNVSYAYFVESRSKRSLARLFGQYVPPELVSEMAENPEKITLEGQARDMTVLFSDVRGFTTLSEKVPPKELSRLMQALLTPITQVIHRHRGTIDKYMGDAVMAFWGAPLDDPQHARNALLAAIEMQQVVVKLNDEFKQKGWPPISIGVGLNTGVMSVGNMGSQFRMAYTVLGDAVNLGSRLEGLTKLYGVDIIVSETTKERLPEFLFRELDRVRVKGKDAPVTIYEPVALAEKSTTAVKEGLARFHHVLTQYRAQQWDLAEKRLRDFAKDEPNRYIYKLYLQRIEHYRNNPPPADWDGVFTHTSK